MTTPHTSGAADLRTAAQAVIDRWDTPLWKDVPATAEYIGRLRAALAAGQATAAQADSVLYDPKAVLDVFHRARAGSEKPVGYLRGILAVIAHWESRPEPHRWMVPAQPAAQQGAQHLAQALTDRENQPNQYGVEFGMSGTHMHFKVGNQLFKLAYEPDEQEEFDFMKRMLVNAFTTFTHDVKTAPQPVAREPLTPDQVKAICVEARYETATLQERADFINGIRHAERHHGIKGDQHVE